MTRIAFLRITEDTVISHRIYDRDYFEQLSTVFDTVRVDRYRSVAELPAWLDGLAGDGVDYLFVFVFAPRYLDYVELVKARNDSQSPVRFLLVPCVIVENMEPIYRALPALLHDQDVVFVFSDHVRRRLGTISPRYDDFPTPCFFDVDAFPENRKAPSDTLDVLYCARLVPEKGLVELLEALHRLKQRRHRFRLHVITDVRRLPELEGYIEKVDRLIRDHDLAPDLQFYGSLVDEQQRRREIMSGCDVLVNLTLYEGETFGRIVVEGFAAGLAVVTTDWQGVNESVTAENGFLVPVRDQRIDVEDVAQALIALYRPETLRRFKQVNRAKARQYDFRPHVERLRQLIEVRLRPRV